MIIFAPKLLQKFSYLFYRYNTSQWADIRNFRLVAHNLYSLEPIKSNFEPKFNDLFCSENVP